MWRVVLFLAVFGEIIAVVWSKGWFADLGSYLVASQRDIQTLLAGAIRALRSGEPAALAGFLALCFGYGMLQAAGPGHGKLVIGGYGAARRITARKLVALSLAASLAQAGVAVLVVYALVAVLGVTRQMAGHVVDGIIAPLGSAAIMGLGLYLVWRGIRGILAASRPVAIHHGHPPDDHPHDHHAHGPDCGCGHAHGPSVAQVQGAQSWREMAALTLGIALRPCTGAVFVLILTWQLGLALAGIAGAFAMGLGTALFTALVAIVSVFAREGALRGLGLGRFARALPVLEIIAGAAIAAAAGAAVLAAL